MHDLFKWLYNEAYRIEYEENLKRMEQDAYERGPGRFGNINNIQDSDDNGEEEDTTFGFQTRGGRSRGAARGGL
jgi:phage antirepressor YoqD-like protein